MEKFGFNHFGGPTVFERFDQPQPTPKDNQVLIKVLAAGLNPYDVALRNGSQASVRPLPFPIFPGTDVVGEIVSLGADVADYRVGEIVINHRSMGAYSEYVTASTSKILRKPASMTIAEAAGLPSAGITAYNILMHFTNFKHGDTVAIMGASGAVGSLLVQLSLAAHLNVIAIANSENLNYLQSFGVQEALAYNQSTDLKRLTHTAKIGINLSHNPESTQLLNQLITPAGTFTSATILPTTSQQSAQIHYQTIYSRKDYTDLTALQDLSELIDQGLLYNHVLQTFPFTLAGIIAGHQLLESHHKPGKIVITH
ncbi:NADP-dependent oxidoreductase [Latilactobacillus graminis]|uniref:Alcohol dehydrogenase GroES-like domain protein n=2 Tax=Latilactobacillus graminis TaxID=60519 RepID=A0AA89KWJ0_9LACO|nr:NADP-dependent oxidoreductase [Latilactobacillus graminis]KRM21118.1 alcohol dehydrogenase GroES-like domain protein [Latilactobacillus graminis DSM 20719]